MARSKQPKNGSTDLDENTDTLEFVAETLSGDIRDAVLREFKAMDKPWQQMTEAEQERLIWRARDIGEQLTRKAIKAVAHKGFMHLIVGVKQFTVTDEIKTQVVCAGTVDNIKTLAGHAGEAVLVLANPRIFFGEREKAEPDVVGDLKMPKRGPGRPPKASKEPDPPKLITHQSLTDNGAAFT